MDLFKLRGVLDLEGTDEAERELKSVSSTAEKSENRMSSAFKKIGAAVAAAFAIDKIKQFGAALVTASAEVAAEEAAFTQIMGEYSETAAAKVNKIAESTGMVDSRLTPYMTSMTAKFKGLGYDIEQATDLASTGLTIAADAAAFWDKSLEDSMSALNSFVNGNYEGGEAIGLFANETTLASWAADNLSLKWADLSEKEKQFARLEFAKAMQEASGASGQAAKESDAYQNVMGNLTEAWRQFKAEAGEPILQEIVLPAMLAMSNFITNTLIPKIQEIKPKITEVIDTFKAKWEELKPTLDEWKQRLIDIWTWITNNKDIVIALAAAIAGAVGGIKLYNTYTKNAELITKLVSAAQTAWSTITGILTGKITLQTVAQKALNSAMKANPIGLIVSLIAALIAAFIAAYNTNEDFRNAVNTLWTEIKNYLAPVFESLKPLLTALMNLFKSIWSLISSLVLPILNAIITVVTKIFNVVSPIIQKLGSVFSTVFSGITKHIQFFIDILTSIINVMTKVVDGIKSGIEKIKNFFKFKFEWPKLKMPHFSISPSGWKIGDLLKGSIPKLGIEWYAKGGIFDEPTIFPTLDGLKGVGEAGPEAVTPVSALQDYVGTAVEAKTSGINDRLDRLADLLAQFFPKMLDASQKSVVLDSGQLVGATIGKINEQLGDLQRYNARGAR